MTTKQRICAAWEGAPADHVPLTTWCFGFPGPASLRWKNGGEDVRYWYTKRMEHIHTLPFRWDLEDDFRRALAWQSIGVDDLIEVSIPWSVAPGVSWTDSSVPAAAGSPYPVMVRDYSTPAGAVRHMVRKTGEEQGEAWVIQPDHAPLIEDFNIPRAERHIVSSPEDVPKLAFLYAPPDGRAKDWFSERMVRVAHFAGLNGFPVQAWSAFGMDAVVWFCGTEGAIMMALDNPEAFARLIDIVTDTDCGRTELAASHPGVDLIVERGWYSSINFWSPALFEKFLFPRIARVAAVAHAHGKRFAYVMTTGIEVLGPRLADAGVDVLYFADPADPVQQGLSLERIRDLLARRVTLVGGISALTLGAGDTRKIQAAVKEALEVFRGTPRFILHPVDAIFPDTPWSGVEAMIEAWRLNR